MQVTLDDLDSFLRQPTPREIPKNLLRRQLSLTRNRFLLVFGSLFFLFGMIFVFVFFPWRLPAELMLDLGWYETAKGVVTQVEPTNMHVNDQTVMRIHFTFSADLAEIESVCYSHRKRVKEGSEVSVRYLPFHPRASRIEHGRLNAFGYFGMLTIIFPTVGAITFGIAKRGSYIAFRLLRDGEFALAEVQAVEATSVIVDNQRRYAITLSIASQSSEPRTMVHHAYGEDVALARKHMNTSEPIGILYDPNRPRRVLYPENLISA